MTKTEAIDILQDYKEAGKGWDVPELLEALDMAIEALQDRPQGEWIHKPSISGESIWWQCSNCGATIYSESDIDRKFHHAYCGVCGADMKGGAE